LTDDQAQKLIDAMKFILNLDYDLYQLGLTYQEKLEKEYDEQLNSGQAFPP